MEIFRFGDEVNGLKLFEAVRMHAKVLSKSAIRKLFAENRIELNGTRLLGGHKDECLRTKAGDTCAILLTAENSGYTAEQIEVGDNPDCSSMDPMFENSFLCVFQKPSGISSAVGSEFEALVQKHHIGSSKNVPLLYRPNKGLSGLVVVARSAEILQFLRLALCSSNLKITLQCICCSKIGEPGCAPVTVRCPVTGLTMSLEVVSVVRCRSQEFLTLVNVTPVFNAQYMNTGNVGEYHEVPLSDSREVIDSLGVDGDIHVDDNDGTERVGRMRSVVDSAGDVRDETERKDKLAAIKPLFGSSAGISAGTSSGDFVTKTIKQVVRSLGRCGLSVVGDKDVVKSSKGVFAYISRVSWTSIGLKSDDPLASLDDFVVQCTQPQKFDKLLQREQSQWDKANLQRECILSAAYLTRSHDSDGIDNRPVEYVLGKAQFCGLSFLVNEHVMIPRPASEVAVRRAIEFVEEIVDRQVNSSARCSCDSSESVSTVEYPTNTCARLLDMGTGSGCLLLSTVSQCQKLFSSRRDHSAVRVVGTGVDLSASALIVAEDNARSLDLSDSCHFMQGDFGVPETWLRACGLPEQNIDPSHTCKRGRIEIGDCTQSKFDLVLCNPPYSSARDIARLSVSRTSHEPHLALFSADGPLGCYRKIANSLARLCHTPSIRNEDIGLDCHLDDCGKQRGNLDVQVFNSGALFLLEVGAGQSMSVIEIFNIVPKFVLREQLKDGQLVTRCLVFQYSPL